MRMPQWFRVDSPWPWLPYLTLYFVPWFFRPPQPDELWATGLALPAFLACYFLSFRLKGWAVVLCGLGMAGIGAAIAPIMPTSCNFVIFAAATLPYARPRYRALIGLGGTMALTLLAALILSPPLYFTLPALFFTVMLGGGGLLGAALQEKNEALEASQAQVADLAAQAERERIARDLHDLLGHTLSVIAVKADLAAKLVPRDPDRAADEIGDIQTTARNALKEIREAVSGMKRASLAAEIGLARRALSAADVSLTADTAVADLPEDLEQTLAMLVREGVTNVVRHARASRCTIRIDRQEDALLLVIADDGRGGIDREGHGLSGMRDRVRAHGGDLAVRSDAGTRIEARLPMGAAA